MKMKIAYLILIASIFLCASDFDEAQAQTQREMQAMKDEFFQMKTANENEFETYKKDLQREYQEYEKELSQHWADPKLSTKKDWVSYSQDKKSRSKVDFENDYIVVETIAADKETAKKRLLERLSYVVGKNTQEVMQSDPLQIRISKINKSSGIESSKIDAKPILSNVIFKTPPTAQDVDSYAKKVVNESPMEVRISKNEHANVYKIKVPLPRNSTLKRSKTYKDEVFKNAERFEVPIPLVFAIMQTESNFNPFAKSHIPAFGLMQIVPTSAGRDTYRFLYKKKGMPSAEYLYNGENNIEMGSTYLHILYYRYLKKITNPESRLYCTIAAYNTGAGNVAWAFTRKKSVRGASVLINEMNPDEVYNHLLENLKYDEPKHYLKRVKKRMSAFKQAYKL